MRIVEFIMPLNILNLCENMKSAASCNSYERPPEGDIVAVSSV